MRVALTRLISLIFSVLLFIDCTFPSYIETVSVDEHQISTTKNRRSTAQSEEYSINFINGTTTHCSVGYFAYNAIKDGDKLVVNSTKIFNACLKIIKKDQVVYEQKNFRLYEFLGAIFLLLVALDIFF